MTTDDRIKEMIHRMIDKSIYESLRKGISTRYTLTSKEKISLIENKINRCLKAISHIDQLMRENYEYRDFLKEKAEEKKLYKARISELKTQLVLKKMQL